MRLTRRWFGGLGTIFVLHRVCRDDDQPLAPMFLSLGTLEEMLREVRARGWDIIGLDELPGRLLAGEGANPFAAFTFDDGYLDNLTLALPLFRKYAAPFAVYVCTGFLNRTVDPWWAALDRLVSERDEIVAAYPGETERAWPTKSRAEKESVFDRIWSCLFPGDENARRLRGQLYARYAIDPRAEMEREAMNWDQVRALAADPLATIGAHTVNHPALPNLAEDEARHEMQAGRDELEQGLGKSIRHFAYPLGLFGAREVRLAQDAGFRTAVTTVSGNVFRDHGRALHSLPRRNFFETAAERQTGRGARFTRNSVRGCDLLVNALRGRRVRT